MDIFYRLDSIKSGHDKVLPLMKIHFEEISPFHKLGYQFKPDVNKYIFLEDAGHFKYFTATSNNEIVGYVAFFLSKHHHCSDILQATMDIFYVDKNYRSKGIGKKLIEFAESILALQGIKFVISSFNVDNDLSSLFASQGYKPMDKYFIKEM